jgi:subtilase family serine protease
MEAAPAQALLGPAAASLSARRNADGGFGESPSTPYATALALEALLGAGVSGEVVEGAVAWLESHQLVDGSWDQRRFDTALVLLALKGGTRPNLTLSPNDLAVDPASAHEGEVVTVAAVVRNVGHVASPATLVRLYSGAPDPGTAIADAALPAIEPGGQSSVSFSFDTTGHAGDLSLYAAADPDNAVLEVREDDNTASRPLHVDGPLPDLAIAPSGLEVPPYPVEQGETLHFDVTVRNAGTLAAPASQLQVVDHGPQGQSVMLASVSVPTLAEGASFHVALTWDTADAALGNHTLAALADAAFAIQESDEEDNLAFAPVSVTAPQPPGPDLDVASVTIAPPTLVSIPQDVQVNVLVHNFGHDAGASVVALYLDAPGGTFLGQQPVDLASHTSVTLTFPLTLDTAGSRTFVAVADPDGTLPETDETNNVAVGVLSDPGNVLDIEVLPQDVTLSSTDLTVGDRLDVTVVVHNRGTRPFDSIPVILGHVDGDNVGELARGYATLGPGESTTLILSWATSILGDPVQLVVKADPFGLLDEVNEDNNDVPLAVHVSPSTLPNLRITGQDVGFSPDPPLEGADATVSVMVHNPGDVPAGPFNVRFYLGDPDAGGVVIGDAAVPGVSAGGGATASMLWSPVNVHGAQGIYVIADSSNAVAEYDETDNRAFRPFAVVGLPDLVLGAADVQLEPSYPRVGEPVIVHASVRNLGGLPAAESVLRAVEGEGPGAIVVGEAAVPALAPGATAEIDLDWAPGSPAGLRLLSLIADANGAIVEADEGNNLARLSVVVQDADLYLTEPYFSPNGDGVKDTTTLAFRAVSPSRVVVSDDGGQAVRVFEGDAIATGTVMWDGTDSRGLLVSDGAYALTIEGAGGVLGRADVVIDTDRSPIHDTAGTALKAVRSFPCPPGWALGAPAFMPAEDEILTIVQNPATGSVPGLVRAGVDGQWSLVSGDPFFQSVYIPDPAAVSPDGRELLVSRFNGGLYAVDLANGQRRLVSSTGSRGAWSPDERFIASNTEVLQRDGTLVVTLPPPEPAPFPPGYPNVGADWMWSPDGEWLAWGPTVVRRNGDLRGVVLPDDVVPTESDQGSCAFLTSRETTWLPNGTLLFSVEAYDAGNEGSCDVVHTWLLQVLPGAQAAVPYQGAWGAWSPDGRKVLYYASDGANPARTVVSRPDGTLPLQLAPFVSTPTPRSTAAWYRAEPAPGS